MKKEKCLILFIVLCLWAWCVQAQVLPHVNSNTNLLLNTDNQTTLVPAHAAQSSVNKTPNSSAEIDTNKQAVLLTDLEFALAEYDKTHLVVDEIILKGNKRTKPFIILRELDFGVGDTLPTLNLPQVIKENQDQINNTRLFNEVVISIDQWMQDRIRLVVEVEERWYIFPAPIFELVDRNFNVWWTEQNRDLSRTKYGFDFLHGNFRGRRETLRAVVRFGYTRQFEFAYQIPFLDKQQKTGIKPRISYITHREIPYTHSDNRNVFYQHDETVRTRFRTGLSFYRRPNIHNDHQLHVYYNSNTIADTIAQLNPNYFLNGQTEQRYFDLAYTFTSDHRDRRAYPLEGKYLRVKLNKQGTGIFDDVNLFWIEANTTQYVNLGRKWYGVANLRGKVSSTGIQPFYNQRGLGYGSDVIRGYELYVIGGQNFALGRSTLKYELLNTKIKNDLIPLSQIRTIPIAAYLKGFGEVGYIQDIYYAENNPLTNTTLYGTGVGLDIVGFYDNLMSLEYSRNGLGEWGFYVSFSLNYDF